MEAAELGSIMVGGPAGGLHHFFTFNKPLDQSSSAVRWSLLLLCNIQHTGSCNAGPHTSYWSMDTCIHTTPANLKTLLYASASHPRGSSSPLLTGTRSRTRNQRRRFDPVHIKAFRRPARDQRPLTVIHRRLVYGCLQQTADGTARLAVGPINLCIHI